MWWTIGLFALLREYPSLWRTQIKDDLHILRRISNIDVPLIAHIHKVIEFYLFFVWLWPMLLKQLLILTLLTWQVECFLQLCIEVIRQHLLGSFSNSFWGIVYFINID